MDVCLIIKQRLDQLGLEQKDLAAAAQVTDSYISQLLTRKKSPPAPDRTNLYERIGKLLKMPSGKLAKLAEIQRREELKRNLDDPPAPLFQEVRELVLRKCASEKRQQTREIFEKQAFGELERLVTQNLLDVVKRVAKEKMHGDKWLRSMAEHSGQSYKQLRIMLLEFLDTDVFHVSLQHCGSFLDPLIDSWEIDPATFGMNIVLNRRFSPGQSKRFEFVETEPAQSTAEQPGLTAFLKDTTLSGDATHEEIAFLKRLRFKSKQPTPLYYYRELQNLRDPLHFSDKTGA